jgi:predicted patatin/cPLA2 family phospholipase
MEKLGLILEGGGLRAGFVAGAVMALMDLGLDRCFHTALAVSASVPTLAYFACGQREEMEQVWREELNTSHLVCYRNIPAASLRLSMTKPVLDIDYLVYDVFKKRYPLAMASLRMNPMKCLFAATDINRENLAFLSLEREDCYLIFNACLAVPGCYPKTVRVNGIECVDAGTINPLPATFLLDQGIHKVLGILSRPQNCDSDSPSWLERTLFWRYFQKYDWMLSKLWEAAEAYKEEVSRLERLVNEVPPRAVIISPDRMPPAPFITRDKSKINRTIDMGYRAVERRRGDILEFLGTET